MEWMSSFSSDLHYGHCKVATSDDTHSEIHALMTKLAAITGWSQPSFMMMGNRAVVNVKIIAGVIKVEKLCAIVLMEVDFNFSNGLMFVN